jgi:membrane dipeptidase
LNAHHRNLKDYQIVAIAKNGGVIQVNFVALFVDSSHSRKFRQFRARHRTTLDSLAKLGWGGARTGIFLKEKYQAEISNILPPLSLVLDHIDHIVKLAGVDHVGLGADFDGTSFTPHDLGDVSSYPNITKGLLERGYKKRDIRKIMGGNFIRVFEQNAK